MITHSIITFLVVICSIQSSRCASINTHLVITAYSKPLAPIGDGTLYRIDMMEKDIIDLLAEFLNFTYEVRVPSDVLGVGLFENGTWTGMVGQLERKEVDLATLGELTQEKYGVLDASVYVFQDNINILIPYPTLGVAGTSALIGIFSNPVWAGIVLSTISVIIAFWCMSRVPWRPRSNPTIIEITMNIYGLIMGQRDYESKKSLIIRLASGFWCLGMLVLISVYRGTLTSLLTSPKYKYVANNVIDIGRNEQLMPHVRQSSPSHGYIMNWPSDSLKPIRERLRKNPHLLLKPQDDYLSILAKGRNNLFIASDQLLKSLLYEDYMSTRRCRFTLAKETIYTRKRSLFLQKNSPLTKSIDLQLLRFHAAGLTKQIENKYVPNVNPCSVQKKQKRSNLTKLNLNQLSGTFLILGVGLCASSFVFIIEYLVYKYRENKRVVKVHHLRGESSCNCRRNVFARGRFFVKRPA